MNFFIPSDEFTHTASFYLVPLYINLNDEVPVISGTNLFFNDLFILAVYFHNFFIEFLAQVFSSIMGTPYEPGFPIFIKGEIEDEI